MHAPVKAYDDWEWGTAIMTPPARLPMDRTATDLSKVTSSVNKIEQMCGTYTRAPIVTPPDSAQCNSMAGDGVFDC